MLGRQRGRRRGERLSVMRLSGKVAIITGSSKGIGEACARKFVDEGAKVVLADIDEAAGVVLADDLNAKNSQMNVIPGGDGSISSSGPARFIRCDVCRTEDFANVFSTAEKHFGGIDILVNNAGVQNVKPIMDTSEEEWNRVIDVNLTSVFRSIKLVVPYMRRRGGGSIVNISSIFAVVGSPGYAAYHASKGGVSSLTRAAAISLIKERIRVNAVCPGTTDTPGLIAAVQETCGDQDPQDLMKSYHAKQQLGRFARAEEIANVVLFVASDEASYVVGAELMVDGAYTVV